MTIRKLLAMAAIALAMSPSLAADPYPSKPIRIVAPYGVGGAVDLTARIIAQQLSEQMGQPVVVENRGGAGGTLGSAVVAKSPPDGYTLLLVDSGTAMAPSFFPSMPYDVAKDFTPLAQILKSPQVFVVNPGLGINSLAEFIAAARAKPGTLNYASAGIGSSPHLMTELFKHRAGIDLVHVPFKGGSEMMNAVIGGQVSLMTAGISTVLPNVKGGKLKALAITTEGRRSSMLPDVPSMKEAGLDGMTLYAWHGLVGPAGMPPEIAEKLRTEIGKAVQAPAVRARFEGLGAEVVGGSSTDFGRLIRAELHTWQDLVNKAGIKTSR